MTTNSAHKDLTSKDGPTGADNITARSRYWLGLKNARIVRVSRAFGGKDRHSKVTTIKGLRDRRVRLSVQTAIQLYDLQDKLGLSQPSKVVDWLLSHSQHEIDKLPPLQMPPNFMQFAPMLASSDEAAALPPQWQAGEKLKYESNKLKPNAGAASHLLASPSAKRSNLGNDQAVQDEMEFLKCVREAPTTDHSSFEKFINGRKHGDAPALANIPFPRLSTHSSLSAAVGNFPYGSHPSKLTEAAASNPNCIQSQLVFCASGGTPMFSSFLDGAELSSKQYHIQVEAAASSNLQLGSIPSHQSVDGVAMVRPSPTASYAFWHNYPYN